MAEGGGVRLPPPAVAMVGEVVHAPYSSGNDTQICTSPVLSVKMGVGNTPTVVCFGHCACFAFKICPREYLTLSLHAEGDCNCLIPAILRKVGQQFHAGWGGLAKGRGQKGGRMISWVSRWQ